MKKIQYMLILFSFILLAKSSIAQTEKQIRNKIERALASYYDTYGRELFSRPQYKNKAYTFGFAISINKKGKIDTIIFSNKTKSLDSLISFKSIAKQLKVSEDIFANDKNTVFVGIALVRREWDNSIDNFYDSYYRHSNPELAGFDQYFYNLIPNIENISYSKSIRLLPAFSLVQMQPKH
ncbi:hypothetical protein [Pedobacter punctiformis]|uniref:Uncharacterized protein n=1 Tax=Pedobacter punctiformis TaxID=3004097 RepID=A0ABT4LA45_9SPHI|nr:hypothetical protein [Pedobacter sp. HCMS5-2]MCZ4244562.1 hypothetical protein [Pedobacter sp. HCMS5-2]